MTKEADEVPEGFWDDSMPLVDDHDHPTEHTVKLAPRQDCGAYCSDLPELDGADWRPPIHLYEGVGGDLPQFPLSVFPEAIIGLSNAVYGSAYSAKSMTAMLSLVAIGACAQRTRRLAVTDDWIEMLGLYVAAVQRSSESKTPGVRAVNAPMVEWTKEQADVDRMKRVRHLCRVAQLQAEIDPTKAKKLGLNFSAEAIEQKMFELDKALDNPPVGSRLFVESATPEALARVALERDGSIAVLSSEGVVLRTLLGMQYGKVPNMTVLNKGYSGETFLIDRQSEKDRAPSEKELAFAVGVTVQPCAYYNIAAIPGITEEGFLPRTLTVWPESMVGHRDWKSTTPVPEEVKQQWGATLRKLLALEAEGHRDLIRCTPEARVVMLDIKQICEDGLKPDGELQDVEAWGGKLAGQIARIAVCFMLAEKPGSMELSAEFVRRADKLRPWMIANATKALQLARGSRNGGAPAAAWAIGSWACRKNKATFSASEAHLALRGQTWVESSKDMTAPLAFLVECGWLRRLPSPPREPGKRGRGPSPRFETHPLILSGEFDSDLQRDDST